MPPTRPEVTKNIRHTSVLRMALRVTWSVACGFREPAFYKRPRLSSRCDVYCGLLPTQPPQSLELPQVPAPFPSPCESLWDRAKAPPPAMRIRRSAMTLCVSNASMAVCDDTENQLFQTRNALLIVSFPIRATENHHQKSRPQRAAIFWCVVTYCTTNVLSSLGSGVRRSCWVKCLPTGLSVEGTGL